MSAVRFETAHATGETPSGITVEGDITGQIGWEVDPQKLVWKMISDATNIKASQRTGNPVATQMVSTGGSKTNSISVIWEEPQAKLVMDGRYDISSGKLEIPNAQLMTEWIAYAGQTTMATQNKTTKIVSQGSLTYDAARVAQRLR